MNQLTAKRTKDFMTKYAIYMILFILILIITIMRPDFMSYGNLRNILIQSATRIIIAMGVGGILITAGTDLSAGRMVGLAAVISSSMLQNPDYARRFFPDQPQLQMWMPIIVAIGVCTLLGILNGIVVAVFEVPPFIATLGMMVIVYGICSLYFDMPPNNSQPIGGLRKDFVDLGTGSFFDPSNGLPYIVVIAILVSIVVYVLHNNTRLGKNMFAIGGNPQAARVSGINVGKNLIIIYAFAGAMYGLAGVLESARTGGASNNYGNGYELDAIAACVVGGVSTSGGVGTVPGMLAGVLIFTIINYGLTFIGANPYTQQIVKGIIIIVAVALDIR